MKTPNFLVTFVLAASLAVSMPANADIVADWGNVATPITNEVSFSFAQYQISHNFTDQYAFSLEGGAGATYEVSFQFDVCGNGCGNPDLSYGIYDANGGLITADSGAVTLSAGNYVFQVKGTGMGSGNTTDYWGSVTFNAVATSMVSPAPEPSSLVLMLFGMSSLGWAMRRRREVSGNNANAGRNMSARTV